MTMFTFEIKNQLAVDIKFNIPGFAHKVHFKPGSHNINTPYHDEVLANLVDIQFADKAYIEIKEEQKKEASPDFDLPSLVHSTDMASAASATPLFADFYM